MYFGKNKIKNWAECFLFPQVSDFKISVKVGFFPCMYLGFTNILYPIFYIAHDMSLFSSMA